MILKKEVEEKKLKVNLSDIVKDLRSKFDVNQKNARDQKDFDKRQGKKCDIFTITRPRKRSEPHETEDDIEVLSKSVLNITFSTEDPRPPNWDPINPLLVTGYIQQTKVHHVYIENGSRTDKLYGHCFRQLPTSWKEGLKPLIGSPLIRFTGHSLWPLGTTHLPHTLVSHDGKDNITRTIKFSVVCFLV